MSRFLFVVPPLAGHINPTIAVGQALASQGNEVAWVGHPGVVERLLPAGARFFAIDDHMPEELFARVSNKGLKVRGAGALKFLWEEFIIPLATSMVSGVDDAVSQFEPDVLIVDQQALAGALVAIRRDIPWATLATTTGELADPYEGMPKVAAWIGERLSDLQVQAGLDPQGDIRWSAGLAVVFSSEALLGPLVGSLEQFPAHFWFVGPSIGDRPEPDFPWAELVDGPRILVSLGTVNTEAGAKFYATVVEAFTGSDKQVILVAPPELVGSVPANFIVRSRVPQLSLMAHVAAVVCHAGHNTVCEALSYGVPLVVAPIKDDQPIIAQQVVASGVGVRVRFARVKATELADAVNTVLCEPEYAKAAAAVSESFDRAGGARAAAFALGELAAGSSPVNRRTPWTP